MCHVILVFLLRSSLHFTTARFGTNSALIAGVGHEETVGGQRGLEVSVDVHVFPRSQCSALSAACMRAGMFAVALVCLRRLRCVCGGVCAGVFAEVFADLDPQVVEQLCRHAHRSTSKTCRGGVRDAACAVAARGLGDCTRAKQMQHASSLHIPPESSSTSMCPPPSLSSESNSSLNSLTCSTTEQ